MTPREVVELWVERFSAADPDGLAELYHADAVNHQVAQDPAEGREAIRAMFRREFAAAEMACLVEAIHEAGEVRRSNGATPWACAAAGSSRSAPGASPSNAATGQAVLSPDARVAHRLARASRT